MTHPERLRLVLSQQRSHRLTPYIKSINFLASCHSRNLCPAPRVHLRLAAPDPVLPPPPASTAAPPRSSPLSPPGWVRASPGKQQKQQPREEESIKPKKAISSATPERDIFSVVFRGIAIPREYTSSYQRGNVSLYGRCIPRYNTQHLYRPVRPQLLERQVSHSTPARRGAARFPGWTGSVAHLTPPYYTSKRPSRLQPEEAPQK